MKGLISVTVMALLSVAPAHEIHFSPLAAIVMLLIATKSETVCSTFIYDELIWKVVLKDFIGSFMKIL